MLSHIQQFEDAAVDDTITNAEVVGVAVVS
jgi:hypothetical protein